MEEGLFGVPSGDRIPIGSSLSQFLSIDMNKVLEKVRQELGATGSTFKFTGYCPNILSTDRPTLLAL